jgi:hypothetical protein
VIKSGKDEGNGNKRADRDAKIGYKNIFGPKVGRVWKRRENFSCMSHVLLHEISTFLSYYKPPIRIHRLTKTLTISIW